MVKKMEYEHVEHVFKPVFDENSKVLILGSFPSVKSREGQFYYHHPQNRFWKIISRLMDETVPVTIKEKKELLLKYHIAVWDVIASCDIIGSSDSSIKNVVPADVNQILKQAPIRCIYANGGTAYRLYQKYCEENTGREAVKLPSSSPANAVWSLERLCEYWGKELLPQLNGK